MEYVNGGKLQSFLRKSRADHYYGNLHGSSSHLSSRDLTSFAYQVARAMEFLETKGVTYNLLYHKSMLFALLLLLATGFHPSYFNIKLFWINFWNSFKLLIVTFSWGRTLIILTDHPSQLFVIDSVRWYIVNESTSIVSIFLVFSIAYYCIKNWQLIDRNRQTS